MTPCTDASGGTALLCVGGLPPAHDPVGQFGFHGVRILGSTQYVVNGVTPAGPARRAASL